MQLDNILGFDIPVSPDVKFSLSLTLEPPFMHWAYVNYMSTDLLAVLSMSYIDKL